MEGDGELNQARSKKFTNDTDRQQIDIGNAVNFFIPTPSNHRKPQLAVIGRVWGPVLTGGPHADASIDNVNPPTVPSDWVQFDRDEGGYARYWS